MSNQLPTTPGLQLPTQKGMVSGNPRDSAIATQNQTNAKQTNLSNAVGGTRRKMRKWGGAVPSNQVVVPQMKMQYQPQGGPGQDPNSVIQANSQTSTQSSANAVYDNYATQKGGKTRRIGSRRKRRGGFSDPKWNWGCYSGGKRSHKSHKRVRGRGKSRKSRKH